MTKAERISEIDSSGTTGEIKSINYKGDTLKLPVKEIKLTALIYNPYNGRIRSSTKSFESSNNRLLNPENPEDKLIIEQFLYDSATGKNEKTKDSLRDNGQQEIGIITKDGVIIDGNRRAMLLNIIYNDDKSKDFFKAVVLPDELADNEKEITLLETSYQMGVDSKVDYNPIEKYIRCKELSTKHGLSNLEIANIMAETELKILEWLNILSRMEDYLIYLGSPEVYTRLEKREGHFVDLNGYLKSYQTKKNNSVNWDYKIEDIQKLQNIYFDYIRIGIPVQRARVLAKPTSSSSFFCQKTIWDDFVLEHEHIKQTYTEESFIELKEKESDKSNEDLIRRLDNSWKERLEERLLDNLSFNESNLKDIVETYNPLKILKRVLNSLGQIDCDTIENTTLEEVKKTILNIDNKLTDIKNKINI